MPEELKTRYRLQVTEEDLQKGKVGDSFKCMATRTVARAIPDASDISVDTQSVAFTVPHDGERVRLTFLTPPVLQGYVIAFDAGEELWPFRFQIQNPYITQRRKRAPASVKATNRGSDLKKRAIAAGATPEEARAIGSEAYREAMDAAFEEAHKVHQDLVHDGVNEPVERAAEIAGLLVTKPATKPRGGKNPDPLFASADRDIEPGKRAPTPRVFKNRRRVYGQRALRINWPIDPETGDRVRPEVTRNV